MARPGFFFYVCPDSELLRTGIEETIRRYVSPTEKTVRLVFWGDDALPPKFWEALTLQGFDPVLRIVVLRYTQAIPIETLRKISKILSKPNSQAMCILCLESAWEKGKAKISAQIGALPCVEFARLQKWWKETPPLDSYTLSEHVLNVASNMGLSFAPGALQSICALLPPHAAAIRSNMEKLNLLALTRGDRVLIPSDAELLDYVPDFNIFTLIRQIQSGNAVNAWKQAAAENPKELFFPLLGLLQSESRLLWQLLSGDTPSRPARNLNERIGLARRIGVAGLSKLWDAVHEAEFSVKSGRNSPEQALDALLASVILLFSPHGR